MGLVIIFALVTILGAIGTFTSFKNKNILGIVFGLGTFLVIGWFTIMTILNSGYPAVH
ncbi:uncharacterized protein DUF2759 [Bacillus oleivorans]|uniref:Uncharacterized protein DUF2759 n=1 Tax=Bacillus oleivorans TaxID=1448271 RepID=A0A285CK30_9BACI|nr:DUF2759 domain-containing protein [Bacillus oleivorans]SNX67932.1 uncharacterized protein DUF2759 [Bacillus oleivorans]